MKRMVLLNLRELTLNYFWVKEGEGIRLNRENFQRYKLKDILSNEIEVDYMYRNNYYRVFDSGSDVFIKSYKLK